MRKHSETITNPNSNPKPAKPKANRKITSQDFEQFHENVEKTIRSSITNETELLGTAIFNEEFETFSILSEIKTLQY